MKLRVPRFGCGHLWRAKCGRRWVWEALIRVDVGAPMVFANGDIQYVKWRKFDQIHVSPRLFFVSPDAHGLSERWGIFVDCNPLAVMALMLVLAASEHLGELNLGGVGSGRR